MDYMRAGDTLVIRALDRIAGADRMAVEMIRELGEWGIKRRGPTEPFLDIDATTVSYEVIAPALFQEETEFVNAGSIRSLEAVQRASPRQRVRRESPQNLAAPCTKRRSSQDSTTRGGSTPLRPSRQAEATQRRTPS